MPRIVGVDIPANKRVEIGLTAIFGIGRTSAKAILSEAKIDPGKKAELLSEQEIVKIRDLIENKYVVEGDLRQEVQENIKRLIEIGSYRGIRHRLNLPARGQRTKSNARTRKGPRGTAVAKRKKV